MSEENTDDQQRAIDVTLLTTSELDKLTPEQIQYVRNLSMRARNPKIYDKVMSVLKDKEQEIIEALSRPPFVYVSPEIEIMPSMKVRFRSLYSLQTEDVLMAVQRFIAAKQAGDLQSGEYMNKLFLAHGLEFYNGDHPANTRLSDITWQNEESDVLKAIEAYRAMRMRWISSIPQTLIGVLVAANQVFQEFYDNVMNLRGPNAGERAEKLVDAVGKSTGPQVAGQKPT